MEALKESLDPVRKRIDDVIGPHMNDLRACFLKQLELDALLVSRLQGEFARNQSAIEIKGVTFNPQDLVWCLVRYEVATSFAAESDNHHLTMFDYYKLYLHDAIVSTWDIVCQFMKVRPGKMPIQSGLHLMFSGDYQLLRGKFFLPYTFKYAKFENLLQLLLDLAAFVHEALHEKNSGIFPSRQQKLTPFMSYVDGFLGRNRPPSITDKSSRDKNVNNENDSIIDSSVANESVEEHENSDISTFDDLVGILDSAKLGDGAQIIMDWEDWIVFLNCKPVVEQMMMVLKRLVQCQFYIRLQINHTNVLFILLCPSNRYQQYASPS